MLIIKSIHHVKNINLKKNSMYLKEKFQKNYVIKKTFLKNK